MAVVRIVDRTTSGIFIKDNLLRGENRQVRVEGDGSANVTARRNE